MKTIPVIEIDASRPPSERWRSLPKSLCRAGRTLADRTVAEMGDDRLRRLAEWMLDVTTVARNPYRAEIAAVAKQMGVPRRTALAANFAYELNQVALLGSGIWEKHAPRIANALRHIRGCCAPAAKRVLGCTAGAAYDPTLGMVHVRALDWDLDGLGRHTVIWHFTGAEAGDYYSVGWPGYVGVLSGMAPGRFSATINQASPFSAPSLQWPPSHLLRHVFENCPDYGDALATLHATPVCFPAFVMLVGVKPGQAAIVELTPAGNRIHAMRGCRPVAIANDYLTGKWRAASGLPGRTVRPDAKGRRTEYRRNRMLTELNRRKPATLGRAMGVIRDTDWLDNEATMQLMVFVPAAGQCLVIGQENQQPVAVGGTDPAQATA
jgi:hypothetical protein